MGGISIPRQYWTYRSYASFSVSTSDIWFGPSLWPKKEPSLDACHKIYNRSWHKKEEPGHEAKG